MDMKLAGNVSSSDLISDKSSLVEAENASIMAALEALAKELPPVLQELSCLTPDFMKE